MNILKNLFKTVKSKKGFTLLEVIVVSTASAIVLMCAIGMFVPLSNSAKSNKELADAKNSSSRIIDFIQKKVQYSSLIMVESSDVFTAPPTAVKAIYQQRKPLDPSNPLKSELLITYFTNTGSPTDGVDVLGSDGFYSNLDFFVTYQQAKDRSVTPNTDKQAIEVTVTVKRKKQSHVVYSVKETIYMFNGGTVDTTGVNPSPPTEEFQYIKF